MNLGNEKVIITAASESYGPSLLSLLGSLNLNWPDHPPVRIYDIGLGQETLTILKAHGFDVHSVPPFCPHWRRHFTWKIWCFNDVKTNSFLWMDAGFVVLEPLREIFTFIDQVGYFVAPNYQLLDWEASPLSCEGCGLPPDFRIGRRTFAGGLMGFQRTAKNIALLQEALSIALHEPYIKATEVTHRHDQAILSLLLYKHYSEPLFSDGLVYLGWTSPRQVPGQKIWVHRRHLIAEDNQYLASHLKAKGPVFFPKDPVEQIRRGGTIRRIARIIRRNLSKKNSEMNSTPYDGVRDE